MSTSTTYHHGDLRATLLQVAGKVMEKEGLAGLSLRDLARRAGVSHNAPYRHFPDRDALLAALGAEGFERLGEAMGAHTGREMGEAYVHFALEHPQRFRLMFGGALDFEKYPGLRTAADAAYQLLVLAFKDLPRPELAAAGAWALVHGLSHLLLDGHFAQAKPEAFAKEVLATVRFAQRA